MDSFIEQLVCNDMAYPYNHDNYNTTCVFSQLSYLCGMRSHDHASPVMHNIVMDLFIRNQLRRNVKPQSMVITYLDTKVSEILVLPTLNGNHVINRFQNLIRKKQSITICRVTCDLTYIFIGYCKNFGNRSIYKSMGTECIKSMIKVNCQLETISYSIWSGAIRQYMVYFSTWYTSVHIEVIHC